MAGIKGINNGVGGINDLQNQPAAEQIKPRSGNFQGTNVNAVQPPAESPVGDAQRLNAARVNSPSESPLSNSGSGYNYTAAPAAGKTGRTGRLTAALKPTDDQLTDFALGNGDNKAVRDFLNQNPALSSAVAQLQSGARAIGSPDAEPKLDSAASQRLDAIGKRLFGG